MKGILGMYMGRAGTVFNTLEEANADLVKVTRTFKGLDRGKFAFFKSGYVPHPKQVEFMQRKRHQALT